MTTTAPQLTSLQQVVLDALVRKGGVTASGHDRRPLDALVRKGLATSVPTAFNPKAAYFTPTTEGQRWTTKARTLALAIERTEGATTIR